uniref:Acyl-coenzyme A thioesterase 8 n=1 Tax=Ditylenchus dipsaci TaxID=166011 RepID=A0A915E811_9BILA
MLSSGRLLSKVKYIVQMGSASESSSTSCVNLDYINRLSQLDEQSPNVFRANFLGKGTSITKNAYGGLLFAQSISAAEKTVEEQFIPHAIHSFFILNVSPERPVDYKVQKLRDGRSFCTRAIQAEQDGNIVYTSQISLCAKEPSAIQHQISMPRAASPETLKPYSETAREFLQQHKEGTLDLNEFTVWEMNRHIKDEKDCVFEFRPTEPRKYIFLAAYVTDATLAGVASRPHYSHGYRPSMVVSLDHSVHFHDTDFRADEWMLYENWSTMAREGRAFSEGRLWTRDGRLILTASQESLNRTRGQASSL